MEIGSDSQLTEFLSHGHLLIKVNDSVWEMISATFAAGYAFFRNRPEDKLPNKLSQDGGYRPYGIEYSKSPDILDEIESFTATDRTRNEKPPNIEARVLHDHMLRTFDALRSIAEDLTIRLAEHLSKQPHRRNWQGAMRRWSRLQMSYARPTQTISPFITESHEDGVLMTLVCATSPGFEVQTSTNDYIPLTTAPGEVIAMAGEITWLLSGGVVKPVYHRVRPVGPYQERLSLIFLGDVHPRLCIPWITNEVNANVKIGERVLASAARFGLSPFVGE